MEEYHIIRFPTSFIATKFSDYPSEKSIITPVKLINNETKEIHFLNSNLANDFRRRVKLLKDKNINLDEYKFRIDFIKMDVDDKSYSSIVGIKLLDKLNIKETEEYDA